MNRILHSARERDTARGVKEVMGYQVKIGFEGASKKRVQAPPLSLQSQSPFCR